MKLMWWFIGERELGKVDSKKNFTMNSFKNFTIYFKHILVALLDKSMNL